MKRCPHDTGRNGCARSGSGTTQDCTEGKKRRRAHIEKIPTGKIRTATNFQPPQMLQTFLVHISCRRPRIVRLDFHCNARLRSSCTASPSWHLACHSTFPRRISCNNRHRLLPRHHYTSLPDIFCTRLSSCARLQYLRKFRDCIWNTRRHLDCRRTFRPRISCMISGRVRPYTLLSCSCCNRPSHFRNVLRDNLGTMRHPACEPLGKGSMAYHDQRVDCTRGRDSPCSFSRLCVPVLAFPLRGLFLAGIRSIHQDLLCWRISRLDKSCKRPC